MAFIIALWLCFAVANARQRLDEAEKNVGMRKVFHMSTKLYTTLLLSI